MRAPEDTHADDAPDPLAGGAAAPPRMIGGGCLARFDPAQLTADSGVDFSAAQTNEVLALLVSQGQG